MPLSEYIRIVVGEQEIQVSDPSEIAIAINYNLEDPEQFQNKRSSEAFDVEIPATLKNDDSSNTFRNPSIEDLTLGEVFKSAQDCLIESNGWEILKGKAILKGAKHDFNPLSYTYNFYGDNADWLFELTDKTLYDFLTHLTIPFDKDTMVDSWAFDGTDEELPYVFAPVRYRRPFNGYITNQTTGNLDPDDDNVNPEYLRPSISKYFLLYWAFKSLGYRIQSDFLDKEYFRRQVMPWTWGNFLDSGGTKLEVHKFLAKSVEDKHFTSEKGPNGKLDRFVDLDVSNDGQLGLGAFDTNDEYSYDAGTFTMEWEYKEEDFGTLDARFSMVVFFKAAMSGRKSDMNVEVAWFVNDVEYERDTIVKGSANGFFFPAVVPIPIGIGTQRPVGQTQVFFDTANYPGLHVSLGDKVQAKIHVRLFRDILSIRDVCYVDLNVLEFKLDSFRIPLGTGSTVDFVNLLHLQNFKIVDIITGIIDEFDLSINTDAINKVVYMEPTHPYSITNDARELNDGYFVDDFIDWNGKEDLSKIWNIENYADIEKELLMRYKEDTNDGIFKLIRDRNTNSLGTAKYVFPERFKTGEKIRENRFYGTTMHYDVTQWAILGTGSNSDITPQIVCIIPENISNTSADASENTFLPKSCYYKGFVTGAGAWRFDGEVLQTYPYMFAVNYQLGGEDDPILSYSDENISGVIGKGLLKRFYWQRLAIMRNGQRYTESYFRLNNSDVANNLHREFKSYQGQKWELIQINGYRPLVEESTKCLLYKWSPIIQKDLESTYPSSISVLTDDVQGVLDIKYSQLKCLVSDIPK